MEKPNKARGLYVLFFLYCIWMIFLLFFGTRQPSLGDYWAQIAENYSIKPLYTIRNYLWVLQNSSNTALIRHCAVNLLGNVLLFIPLGYFFPRLWRFFRPFWRFFLWAISLLLLIECLQLFSLRGRLDVDDIILNFSGMLLGFIFHKFLK
ncbi:MAG: hypothetical protein E7461_00855 [Ruminococcaceae bacterium]|nr:hypothetical protein [Oscillospiraceae bacterium]